MAGFIGSKASVTLVDGYNRTEADAEFVAKAGDTMTGGLTGTDLTLSGGVYLGGTGSANKLDDYEEGTWTPSFNFDIGGTGITYGYQVGYYTKIGQLVHITFTIQVTGGVTSSDYFLRLALPFASTNVGNAFGRVSVQNTFRSGFNVSTQAGISDMLCYATNGQTDYAKGDDIPAGTYVGGSITYRTTE